MTFAHPHFAEPRWLWLAVLGPLLLLALQRYSAWARRNQLAQLAAPQFVGELTRSHSPIRRTIKNAMLVLAVFVFPLIVGSSSRDNCRNWNPLTLAIPVFTCWSRFCIASRLMVAAAPPTIGC